MRISWHGREILVRLSRRTWWTSQSVCDEQRESLSRSDGSSSETAMLSLFHFSLSLSLFSLDPSQRTNIIVCSSCWLLNRDDGEEAKRRHRVNNKIRWSVQETFVSTALNWPSFLVMKFFAFNLISPDFHLDMKKGQNVQKTWTVSSFLCISRCRTQLVETDDQKVIFRQKWIDRTDDLIRYSVEKSKTDLGNLFEERSN